MQRSSQWEWLTNKIVYFTKLCILVVLWSGCFGAWLRHLTNRQVDPRLWTNCKLYFFLFYFGRHYSSMLLVLMSVEKCFAVYFPLKAQTICTLTKAKWMTCIVGVIIAGYDSLYFFVTEYQVSESSGSGSVFAGNFRIIMDNADSILYSFGPFALMFLTNSAIAFKFIRAKCNQINSTQSTSQALSKVANRGTAMVVTVSVTFLLLTAPVGVDNALSHIIRLTRFPFYRLFMNLTQYLNHSINGILYCLVGSRFRSELLKILGKKENRESISSEYTS